MWALVQQLLAGQVPPPFDVPGTAQALERGGLYSIVALLLGAVIYLYRGKERQHAAYGELQTKFQERLLSLVEKQTEVLTKQHAISEKVESVLARAAASLDARRGG